MPYINKDGIPQCKKSGVYCITNKVNGKVYVGSATSIKGRLWAHRNGLRRGRHDNKYLQRGWDKYGESSFRFSVIETCEIQDLIVREQYWIDNLKSSQRPFGYNLAPMAGSTRGYKWSEESLKRNREKRKGTGNARIVGPAAEANRGKHRPKEVREKIAKAHKGRPKSEEHRKAIKESHWSKRPDAAEIIRRSADGNRGKRHSEEHRAKISESGKRAWIARRLKMLTASNS